MVENRVILESSDLDGFDKRKLPSPGFQVEVVMTDYDGTIPPKYKANHGSSKGSDRRSGNTTASSDGATGNSNQTKVSGNEDNDNVFSDSDGEESVPSRSSSAQASSGAGNGAPLDSNTTAKQIATLTERTEKLSVGGKETAQVNVSSDMKTHGGERSAPLPNLDSGDIKAIAADASVFSFGDAEDYESE